MVAFLIYWASILISIAWIIISVGFCIYYLSNKENGNLWAFAFLNVLAAIFLAIVLLVYKTWDFDITTYSSLMYGLIAAELVLAVIKGFLGREPKLAPAK
ncbi:hypothetical protein [Vagococcus intermedius]|uniref:Uncharacterized protein n=1 Tax=Vagococcus intermedius TaxID=2991418 RepID=A0AAF0I7D4_9ENTE|nr:hypothetical protein [Vagococcus intermedius]WEG73275.1 hypothetical protein OL234_10125 [Vagococcus intermedius]WEG75357.1 hypothetical protein OL235_10120 [Vagococcus intermedius]